MIAEERTSLAIEIAAALKTRIIRRRKNMTYAESNINRAFYNTKLLGIVYSGLVTRTNIDHPFPSLSVSKSGQEVEGLSKNPGTSSDSESL